MSEPRRRRRSSAPSFRRRVVLGLIASTLIVALLAATAHSAANSTSFKATINRSFAAQTDVNLADSNQTGTWLDGLLVQSPTKDRLNLQAALDQLVALSAAQSRAASIALQPAPSGGAADLVNHALALRAQGIETIRTTVDGLLQMAPLPIAGSTKRLGGVPPPWTPRGALTLLAAAAAGVEAADGDLTLARRRLEAGPGHVRLLASSWWPTLPLQSPIERSEFIAAITSAPSLVQRHELGVVAITTSPSSLPGSTSQRIVVLPTTALSVAAIVRNGGNVAEPGVSISMTLVRRGLVVARSSTSASLFASSATAVKLNDVTVLPGASYTLTIDVAPRAGEPLSAAVADTVQVEVAPQ